ncbi:hypothetical protein H8E77_16655 [bacterium]|nr:hypothetical protein [bacterium]
MNSIRRFVFSGFQVGELRLLWLSIVIIGIFCFVGPSEGKILPVPSEYDTIQSAIDAASNGDEVVVADGTYKGDENKNIDFLGKAITVRSENGPGNCIIDCENSGRGFYFHNGEDSNSILKGFTIRNGYVNGDWPEDSGAGILCNFSSPTIQDNIVTENSALYAGGGICCYESSPLIRNNIINENSAYLGGGIYCFRASSSAIIDNNIIDSNSAEFHGGGIFCSAYSYFTIINNIVKSNSAPTAGGVECYH